MRSRQMVLHVSIQHSSALTVIISPVYVDVIVMKVRIIAAVQ